VICLRRTAAIGRILVSTRNGVSVVWEPRSGIVRIPVMQRIDVDVAIIELKYGHSHIETKLIADFFFL